MTGRSRKSSKIATFVTLNLKFGMVVTFKIFSDAAMKDLKQKLCSKSSKKVFSCDLFCTIMVRNLKFDITVILRCKCLNRTFFKNIEM